MKKISISIICFILLFLLCGCELSDTPADVTDKTTSDINTTGAVDTQDDFYPEHQELTGTDAKFDENGMLRVSLLDVGLENVIIKGAELGLLDEDSSGTVYLLADDRYGKNAIYADYYLAIAVNGKIIVKDMSAWDKQVSYSGHIELCDVDGDFDDEIVLQETTGISGGAGSYLSRVFDFKNGEIVEMFSSRSEDDYRIMDTGFSINLLENRQFEIQNSITGYSETFQDERKMTDYSEDYYKWWYTDEGEVIKGRKIMVDSFFEFVPVDIDGDFIYELKCKQYVSLISHGDGIGWANTVLKYNNELGCFEIVEASFDPRK